MAAVGLVAVSFWSSCWSEIGGIPPGVFAKSAEVVLNERIAKLTEIKSVEVTGGTGLAGGPSVERVRRGDFHISW